MKCIRYYRPYGGKIERVSDDEAAREVDAGLAVYVSKQEWKFARAQEAGQ